MIITGLEPHPIIDEITYRYEIQSSVFWNLMRHSFGRRPVTRLHILLFSFTYHIECASMKDTSCTVLRARCLLGLIGVRDIDGMSISSWSQRRKGRRFGSVGVVKRRYNLPWNWRDWGRNCTELVNRWIIVRSHAVRLRYENRMPSVNWTSKHGYWCGWYWILRCSSRLVFDRCVRRSCRGGLIEFSTSSLLITIAMCGLSFFAPSRLNRGFFGLKALLLFLDELTSFPKPSSSFQSWTLETRSLAKILKGLLAMVKLDSKRKV